MYYLFTYLHICNLYYDIIICQNKTKRTPQPSLASRGAALQVHVFVAHRTSAKLVSMAIGLASPDMGPFRQVLLYIASITSVEELKGGFDSREISITWRSSPSPRDVFVAHRTSATLVSMGERLASREIP
jgi:hypothetical protein